MNAASQSPPRAIGRYVLFTEIASGGMATLHIGRLQGPVGFSRTVAIKRLHPQFAKDPEFVSMALDEARLAARVQHPNVVSVLDVVALEGELFLVMDYIKGESLSKLLKAVRSGGGQAIPPAYAVSILSGALQGLHAAHEATTERGLALHIVHRDVSPQNILVGTDGIARVVDFGIAKAANRIQSTREGQLKGKLCYMGPEQLMHGEVDRRTDIYAASVVLWQALVGKRLFPAEEPGQLVTQVLQAPVEPPSKFSPGIPKVLDAAVLKGLSRNPGDRFATAREMALALEAALAPATPAQVGDWVERTVAESLRRRASTVAEVESISSTELNAALTESAVQRASTEGQPHSAVASDSQVSSISVATPSQQLAPRRSRTWVVVGSLAAVAILSVIAVILWTRSKSPTTANDASAAAVTLSASPPAQGSSVPTAPPAASPTAVPSQTQPLAVATPPSASVSPPKPISGKKTQVPTSKKGKTLDPYSDQK